MQVASVGIAIQTRAQRGINVAYYKTRECQSLRSASIKMFFFVAVFVFCFVVVDVCLSYSTAFDGITKVWIPFTFK